jgi:hypothetical protein
VPEETIIFAASWCNRHHDGALQQEVMLEI